MPEQNYTTLSGDEPTDSMQDEQTAASPNSGAENQEPEATFSWEASEYVHHHKSILWYAVVVLVVIGLLGVAVWFKYWLEIGVFLMMGAAVFVYANKPPRTMSYELSSDGIRVDGKLYSYSDIRSFSVMEDEDWHYIDLEPTKRLSLRVVILFDSSNYDEIVGHLERHIPRQDRDLDLIEKITRKARF